jgi:hypothetical protein
VHLDIERSEVPETTTARSLGQEKIRSENIYPPRKPSLSHPDLLFFDIFSIWRQRAFEPV